MLLRICKLFSYVTPLMKSHVHLASEIIGKHVKYQISEQNLNVQLASKINRKYVKYQISEQNKTNPTEILHSPAVLAGGNFQSIIPP